MFDVYSYTRPKHIHLKNNKNNKYLHIFWRKSCSKFFLRKWLTFCQVIFGRNVYVFEIPKLYICNTIHHLLLLLLLDLWESAIDFIIYWYIRCYGSVLAGRNQFSRVKRRKISTHIQRVFVILPFKSSFEFTRIICAY